MEARSAVIRDRPAPEHGAARLHPDDEPTYDTSVRRTASCQPAHLRARVLAFMRGTKRCSRFHDLAKASGAGHTPAGRPARWAAPSAVVSITAGRSTGASRMS